MNPYFIEIQTGTGGLYGLALQGSILYVSAYSGSALGVYGYNVTTEPPGEVSFVPVNEPWGIAIGSPPPNGKNPTLYVASNHDSVIYEFDATTGARLSNSIKLSAAKTDLALLGFALEQGNGPRSSVLTQLSDFHHSHRRQ